MATEVLSITSEESYWPALKLAAKVLREGGLVAFPTETVYGVGACVANKDAVDRLRVLKDRSESIPLTLHVGQLSEVEQYVASIPQRARNLMRRCLPGPLTLIFEVPDPRITPIGQGADSGFLDRLYHQGTIGIRCPDHRAALDLLTEAQCAVPASSANLRGQPPPVTADDVLTQLDGKIDVLLDGGETRFKGPSTIVRVSENDVTLLREGVLTQRTIDRLSQTRVLLVCTGNTCRSPMAEGLLKAQLAKAAGCAVSDLPQSGFAVSSAGCMAFEGAPATPEAVEALREMDVDISDHRSTQISKDIINAADRILVMTESHKAAVLDIQPEAQSKVQLVTTESIADPIGGSAELYRACRDRIAEGLQNHVAEMVS